MKPVVAIAVASMVAVACSGRDGGEDIPVSPAEATQTLYIVGSGTSVADELPDSLRQAWPRLLFTDAFPRSTILVNGATGPTTAAEAIAEQVPLALELRPETIAAWIGSYDLNRRTPIPDFGRAVRDLLDALVATGAEQVLVADIPRLPAYDDAVRRAYNAEIEAAARGSGAALVEIADLDVDPVDEDADYQPDAAGHRAIAAAFAEAVR